MVLKTDSFEKTQPDNNEGKTWELRYDTDGKPYCYSFKKEAKVEEVEVEKTIKKKVKK